MIPRLKEAYSKEIQPALKESFIHISNLRLVDNNKVSKKTEAKK